MEAKNLNCSNRCLVTESDHTALSEINRSQGNSKFICVETTFASDERSNPQKNCNEFSQKT